MDIFDELTEISNMISKASIVSEIKKSASSIKKDATFTDGLCHPRGRGFDVVISSDEIEKIGRRIREDIPTVRIVKIGNDLLGIKATRRGSGV